MELVVRDTSSTTRADLVARSTGTLLVAAACWLPWLSGRLGTDEGSVSLSDLPAARWFLVALVAVIVVTLVVDAASGSTAATTYAATCAATVLVVGPLLLIAVAEIAAVWLAPERLPTSLRRLAVGLDPQAGLVLAAARGTVVLTGTLNCTEAAMRAVRQVVDRAVNRDTSAIGLLVGTLALGGIAVARYGSWLQISSTFGNWDVPGWSLPWFGVLTLALVLLGITTLAASVVRPGLGTATTLIAIGWALTFPAAISITASAIGTVRAPPWVREHLVVVSKAADDLQSRPELAVVPNQYRPDVDIPEDLRVSVGVGTGAIVVFGLGLALAAAGLAMAAPVGTNLEESRP